MLKNTRTAISALRPKIRVFSQKWGALTVSELQRC